MTFFEYVDRIDKWIVLLVNHDASRQTFDNVMLILREPLTWIPLYVLMAWYFRRKAGGRFWVYILLSLVTLALTDSISTLLKDVFGRLRPCYDGEIGPWIRQLTGCGGLYSFPSSHAANHFGLATCWYVSVASLTGKKWKFLWIWAALVCYAQIYVGKHFPSDILAGALLGVLIATLVLGTRSFFEFQAGRVRQVSLH